MSKSKTLPRFSLNSFISPTQARDWYKSVGYQDAKNIIKEKMKSSVENFIAIGYYLKHIDETEQYKEDGYVNIWECAKQEFGFSQARASRCINICKAYSVDGDSPYIDEQFKNFNPSQLQEMLPFKDDEHLIGQITPDMSSREIRKEIRNAKKEGAGDKNEGNPLQGQMQIMTIEGEYREFEPVSGDDDETILEGDQEILSEELNVSEDCKEIQNDKLIPEKKSIISAKADLTGEKEEATKLLCNDENIEEAVEFIFDSCNSNTFSQNVLDELVELFRKGEGEHNGYNSQQSIFDNMLPFKNDVVEVSNQCGYMVKYIHTNEWIRIPVYPFWKAFGKYYEWMWKENVCVPDGQESNGDSEMRITQYLQIGTCLKIFRTNVGMAQKEMAGRLKLSVATYSNYENGYSSPTIEIIQEFCEILEIGVYEFFRYAIDRVLMNINDK